MTKKFNHTIPRCILNNFHNDLGKENIYYLDKESGEIDHTSTDSKTSKKVGFGSNHFYSKTKLSCYNVKLMNKLRTDWDIEDNLGLFESSLGQIVKNIKSDINYKFSEKDIDILKQYCYVQHTRTPKYKFDTQENLKNNDLLNISKEQLIDKCYSDYHGVLPLTRKHFEQIINPVLPLHMNKFIENINDYKQYGPEYHSQDICNKDIFEGYLELTDISNKNIIIMRNNTHIPFIINDVGVGYGYLETQEFVIYLILDSNICLLFTYQETQNIIIKDTNTIERINEIYYKEAFKEVYGGFYLLILDYKYRISNIP